MEEQSLEKKEDRRSPWKAILFVIGVEALLVAFCTIAAFVLFQALLYAMVTTFRFQSNEESLMGVSASLRLRQRPAWKNWLWFASNACVLGVAAFVFARADTKLFPVPQPGVDMKGAGGALVVGIALIATGLDSILMRRSIVEGNRPWRKLVHRLGLPYQSDRSAETNNFLVGALAIVGGIGFVVAGVVLRIRG